MTPQNRRNSGSSGRNRAQKRSRIHRETRPQFISSFRLGSAVNGFAPPAFGPMPLRDINPAVRLYKVIEGGYFGYATTFCQVFACLPAYRFGFGKRLS